MRKHKFYLTLLLSLIIQSQAFCLRPATRYSRKAKYLKETAAKFKALTSKTKILKQEQDEELKKCCTPKTTKTILSIFSGIILIIKTIIKLASK